VTKFMSELVDVSGACVEMINHMGKASSSAKDMTQFAGRGGSGLPSNSRVSRVLRSLDANEYQDHTGELLEENKSAMLCMINKFTDGSPLLNKPFVILREGFLFSRKSILGQKEKEIENKMTDTERVFAFIKESRRLGKWPTKSVVVGHFMAQSESISEARIKRAIDLLHFSGHLGELVKSVDHPDVMTKDKALVVTDMDGNET